MPEKALFTAVGDGVYRPSELTRGPWSGDAQHGGPVAALLAAAVEAMEPERDLQVARLTFEFLRAIPLTPLRIEASVEGSGRSVDRVSAYAADHASGEPVAVVMALRIRRKQVAVPTQRPAQPPRGPEGLPATDLGVDGSSTPSARRVMFAGHGIELRTAHGSFRRPGPAAVWFRLRHPVVAGQPTSPLQRVAAAADFGNGISSLADFRSLLFINPDLTIALHRYPAGDWVCLDARSRLEGNGIGGAEAGLFDEGGSIGRAYQTLLLSPR